ncbi:unnamed protein product [Malus baccata var. baccata]
MAEAVVSMVVKGLKGVLVEKVKLLNGVSDQIEHAQIELLLMQSFLEISDAKQGDNEVVRIWVRIIRDAAYDLEDVVESFALKVALKRGGSVKLVLKRFACIPNEVVNRHKIANNGYTIWRCHIFREAKGTKTTYPHVIELDVVRLEKDMDILTTFAKQVYDHNEAVKRHFNCFAWVCVSQQCQGKEVLEDILKLCIIQKEKKCLVVLDDIWTHDAWNSLNPGFPIGEETKSQNGFVHKSRPLNNKESWELFEKISIFGRDQTTLDPGSMKSPEFGM